MSIKKLAVLNTTIATTDGSYVVETVSLDRAKRLAFHNREWLDSAVGHESTAKVMKTLLDVDIPVNRQQFSQEVGQTALVFKMNGRPPEGKILSVEEIEEMGYTFKTMTRTA